MSLLDAQICRRLLALGDDERLKPRSERLTDEMVRSLVAGPREIVLHDTYVSRLFIRVRPAGSKGFYFACSAGGRDRARKVFIGSVRDLSVDQARLLALDLWEDERANGIALKRNRLPQNVTVAQALEAYSNRKTPERSVRHVRHTQRVLGPFIDAYRDHQVSQLRRGVLLSWVARAGAVTPSRSRAAHKALRAVLSWCVETGAIEYNPLARTPSVPSVSHGQRVLKVRELSKIYAESAQLDTTWRVMVRFLMLSGATVEAARKLHRSQVDLAHGLWSWESCAPWDSPRHWVPLSEECCRILGEVPIPAEYFFQSPRKLRPYPTYLHSGVLRDLQRNSETTDWSWRDLVRSVRSALGRSAVTLPTPDQRRARDDVDRWAKMLVGVPTNKPSEDEDVVL